MSDVIGNAQILLSANTARFEQGLTRAKDTARESFADMKEQAVSAGQGIAVGLAVATVALGEMIKSQVEYASEMETFAKTAGVSVQKMQELSASAKILGMDTDDLNDIYDDLNQKMGEFTSKGDSELKDLFEQLPKAVNLTAESFRNLSGPEAMQKYYDALEKSNMTEREKVYWMEQFASESSKLIPFLRNHGALQKEVNEAMEKSGAIMDEKTLKATRELKAGTQLLDMSFQGVKNQLTQGLLPVFADMAGSMVKDTDLKNKAKVAGDGLAVGFKYIVATGRGVIGIFQMMGTALGGFIAAVAQLGTVLDGVDFSSPMAFFQIGKNMLGVPEKVASVLKATWADVTAQAKATDVALGEITQKWGTGESSGLVKKLAEANSFKGEAVKGKAIVKNEDDDDEDGEKKGKKKKEGFLLAGEQAVLDRAMQHAIQFGYAKLEEQNHIPKGLMTAISMSESAAGIHVRSPAGAIGEFQMLPATARRFGLSNTQDNFKTALQAPAAAKFLGFLYQRFGGNIDKTIAAYNTGEGNVDKHDFNLINSDRWAHGETKNYLAKNRRYLAYINGGSIKNMTAGQFIDSQSNSLKEQQNQQKDLEKQRLEFEGDKKAQIDKKWQDKFLEVANNPQSTKDDIEKAKVYYQNQAKLEWQVYRDGIKEQVKNSASFAQNDVQKILDEAKKKTEAANTNAELNRPENAKAKEQILANIEEEKQYRLGMLDLVHTKEEYNNNKEHYTTLDRIKIEAGFKQAEIEASNRDLKTKQGMLEQLKENTDTLIENTNQSFRDELEQITGIGKSELQKIMDDFEKKRRILDKREDIDDSQKSTLRNALAGAEVKAKSDIRKTAETGYNSMIGELTGNTAFVELNNKYKTQHDTLLKWKQQELITTEKYNDAMQKSNFNYMIATNRLYVSTGGSIANSVSEIGKIMLGEHQKSYKALFAMNQSFVMAQAGLNMYKAISDAWANGSTIYDKMAGAATAATELVKIVTAAQQVKMQGFANGGYTGDIPENAVAGLVHGGEYVFDAEATKAIGKNKLEKIRRGDLDPSTNNTTNNAVSVNVAVNHDGSSSVESSHEIGKNLGNVIEAAIQKALVKESRQGGRLSARGR